jgi:uncharacterized protein YqiB (DUF1249 family)
MHCPVQRKPKTTERFGNLMELYERNYVQLRLLIPDLRRGPITTTISQVPGCMTLYLQLTEQSPYTSTLRLTYRFIETASDGQKVRAMAEPDLTIRVYHDARSAEVMSGLLHGQQHPRKTRGLDGSWHLNRFLYKWLRYLLYRGHGFRLSEQPQSSLTPQPNSSA